MPADSQNYELWETRNFLGVYQALEPDPLYWAQWFQSEILSEEEWIDFEKIPVKNRKLAPFVMPLGRGKSVYTDKGTGFRFKPAYTKTQDQIDPLMPLTRRVGIDANMLDPMPSLSPSQRLNLIRAAMTASHVEAHNRTLNYMAAVVLRDGKITLKGEEYPETLVDFQRAANHTVTLGVGERFGDAGVSALDFIQLVIDRMTTAEFGGMPTRITMGGGVWAVLRKMEEVLKFLDLNLKQNDRVEVERGLTSGEPVFKVGELMVGGSSGQRLELWVDNSTFVHPETGAVTRYIGLHQMLFTASPAAINGFQVFGRIIDRKANWQPMRLFPKNWVQEGDVDVEYITHKSAPLMVPVNPNATLLANVIAAV
jgi:hypothetical protein